MAEIEFPWERQAMTGAPMPDGLSYADKCAFQALAHLYARYRLKTIERQQASREKTAIKLDWAEQKRKEQRMSEETRRYALIQLETEQARTQYRKSKTVKEWLTAADKLVERLDGIPVNHAEIKEI